MILILITNETPHGLGMSPFVSPNKGVRAMELNIYPDFHWCCNVFLLFPPSSIDFLPVDGMWSNTNTLTDAHDRLQVIPKNTLDIKMIARVTRQVFWILIIPARPSLMTFISLPTVTPQYVSLSFAFFTHHQNNCLPRYNGAWSLWSQWSCSLQSNIKWLFVGITENLPSQFYWYPKYESF